MFEPTSNAGDVAYWNGSEVKTISINNWKKSLGTPIGVVVVPKGFAPDKKIRICALNNINATGEISDVTIRFAINDGSSTSKHRYNVEQLTDYPSMINYSGIGTSVGRLPADSFIDGFVCDTDNLAKYQFSGNSNNTPSPYIFNDEQYKPNPEYHRQYDNNGVLNALSDLDGLNNTEILSTISGFEAAKAIDQYKDGISDLKWYLPAIGELGYLGARWKTIYQSLSKLDATPLKAGYTYLSSTESNGSDANYSSYAYVWVFNIYQCTRDRKDVSGYVRPFAKIDL